MAHFFNRNVRNKSVFNFTTQQAAVRRFARNSNFLNQTIRKPFEDANRAIRTAENLYGTAINKSGLKDNFHTTKLKHRTVGRDAMIEAREMQRQSENNPLLKSVETKPVSFSRRDVSLVDKESKKMVMDVDDTKVRINEVLPRAVKSELNLGNTLPQNSEGVDVKEYAKPHNYSELENVVVERSNKRKQMTVESSAPVLSKKPKMQSALDVHTAVAKANAKMFARYNV